MQGEIKSSFFDNVVISPNSTIQILEEYRDKTLKSTILDASRYDVAGPAGDGGIRHKDFESLYLYHDNLDNPEELISKWNHIIDNFQLIKPRRAYFIWSSIQPNLPHMVASAGGNTDQYYLTKDHYNRINSLIQEIFEGVVMFISRAEDVDPELTDMPNVNIINLDRNIMDYKGPTDLYRSILETAGFDGNWQRTSNAWYSNNNNSYR